jgi:hypothetical protein
MTRYLLLFDNYGLVIVGCPLWREDGSVFCQSHYLQYKVIWPLSVQDQYVRLCRIYSSFRYNGSLVTRTVVCLTAQIFYMQLSRYSLCTDPERTLLPKILILLSVVDIGADRIENTGSPVVTVLFPSNGFSFTVLSFSMYAKIYIGYVLFVWS